MSDRIAQLRSLLDRVQKNAAAPRPRRIAPPPPLPFSDTRARSFESARPPEPEDEVPVPLVRVASAPMAAPAPVPQPEPSPIVEATSPTPFSMTTEVTTVEFAESVPPPPAAESEVEDLSSDLLESLPPPEPAWAGAVQTTSELVEEPPISSQRPRLVSGVADALSESAPSEAPPMTPPPESGPQEAPSPPAMFSPGVPDVDSLLDDGAGPISRAPSDGPSPEQIGESVELDEREGPSIELAEAATPVSVPPNEELEAMLDAPPTAGIYDEALMPPPGARDELEAHDRRVSTTSASATPVEGTPSMPDEATIPPALPNEVAAAPFVPPTTAEASGFAAPEVFSPAMPSGGAPEFKLPAPSFRPSSFLELLDASLELRG